MFKVRIQHSADTSLIGSFTTVVVSSSVNAEEVILVVHIGDSKTQFKKL